MDRRRRRIPVWAWLLVAFMLISFARVITGSNELDSAGTLREAITAFIPIALAGLAGLWSERAGVVNIGLEGMMILGTIGAGYFGTFYGPWQAVIAAMVFGAVGGALHALATVIFGVDHIVSGVAINIMAVGVAAFLADLWFSGLQGGGPTQSPPVEGPASINLTGVSDWAKTRRGQALVPGLRPGVGGRGADPRPVAAHRGVGAAGRRDVLHPLEDVVRPAAALVRREPERRRDAGCERLPLQDLRGAGLRGHRRPGRRLHRARRRRALPERHHQRPRLHRPRGDDLRQLAARAGCCSARRCSATPTRSSCAPAAGPCTRC